MPDRGILLEILKKTLGDKLNDFEKKADNDMKKLDIIKKSYDEFTKKVGDLVILRKEKIKKDAEEAAKKAAAAQNATKKTAKGRGRNLEGNKGGIPRSKTTGNLLRKGVKKEAGGNGGVGNKEGKEGKEDKAHVMKRNRTLGNIKQSTRPEPKIRNIRKIQPESNQTLNRSQRLATTTSSKRVKTEENEKINKSTMSIKTDKKGTAGINKEKDNVKSKGKAANRNNEKNERGTNKENKSNKDNKDKSNKSDKDNKTDKNEVKHEIIEKSEEKSKENQDVVKTEKNEKGTNKAELESVNITKESGCKSQENVPATTEFISTSITEKLEEKPQINSTEPKPETSTELEVENKEGEKESKTGKTESESAPKEGGKLESEQGSKAKKEQNAAEESKTKGENAPGSLKEEDASCTEEKGEGNTKDKIKCPKYEKGTLALIISKGIFDSKVVPYLEIRDQFEFSLTQKQHIQRIIEPLKRLLLKYKEIMGVSDVKEIKDKIFEIRGKNTNESLTSEPKPFEMTRTCSKAICLLDTEKFNWIFSTEIGEEKLGQISLIYRIYCQLLKNEKLSKIESSKEFWERFCKFLNESKIDGKISSFIIDSVNSFNYDRKNVLKLKSLIHGNHEKLKPNYFGKICGTTALFVFLVKDALEYCGAVEEKKTQPQKSLILFEYEKEILENIKNIIEKLSCFAN